MSFFYDFDEFCDKIDLPGETNARVKAYYHSEAFREAEPFLEALSDYSREEKAREAEKQAKAAFGGGDDGDMPTVQIEKSTEFISDVLVAAGLAKSKGEAKRLIEGGGVAIGENKISDPFAKIPDAARKSGEFILHKGKKAHVKVVLK